MNQSGRVALPTGMERIDGWTHAGVECAIAAVGGSLYGLARIRGRAVGWASSVLPVSHDADERAALAWENLGEWLAFAAPHLSGYWAPEALSRMATPSTGDLVAWDVTGHTWAVDRWRTEVNEFVDTILADVVVPRGDGNAVR